MSEATAIQESFNSYKRGLWTGNAKTYRAIADWIEEDLSMGRSLERYPETLRRNAQVLEDELAAMDKK